MEFLMEEIIKHVLFFLIETNNKRFIFGNGDTVSIYEIKPIKTLDNNAENIKMLENEMKQMDSLEKSQVVGNA